MVNALTAPVVPSAVSAEHVSPEQWRTVVNRITRRQFGLAGAAVLALSACGTDGQQGGGGAGEEGAGGREVEDAMGAVTVPEQAERVVALDSLVLDTVVALGAPLVGAARIIADVREFLG